LPDNHRKLQTPRSGEIARPGRWASARLKFVVVAAGAVLMALEILGSRVLAPSFGSSVYVWGSLISTFLLALALGYALGGQLADRRPSASLLGILLASAAVLILPCVVWAPRVLAAIGSAGWDQRWAALFAAIVFFLPPSIALGMVTPFAVRLASRGFETAGSVAGGYSALSTAGSIAGTLLMTFFLIPRLPVDALLLDLALALLVCAAVLMRDRTSIAITGIAGAACLVAALGRAEPASTSGAKVLARRDTPYHHIVITELDGTRWMRFDARTQSAVDMNHPDRSAVKFDEGLAAAFAMRPSIRRVLVIGLGGGILPRRIHALLPDADIESVEIDPVVRDLAVEYFLYKESERVRTRIEDGRTFLTRKGPEYDLIVLDAFNSTGVPFHLTTKEFFETLRTRLSHDGIFAANFIGNLMGRDGKLFWATYATIRRQFGQVYVSPDVTKIPTEKLGNVFVYATVSADPIPMDELRRRADEMAKSWHMSFLSIAVNALVHSPEPPPGTTELTDAYAPVEALQHF
jgi:spermidine synthase